MENVMNFLAEYYIWFFVAALVLCFALIGFIIDARKKKKSEFKGESIEETKPVQTNEAPVNTDPQVVGNTVNVGGEATLGSTNTVSDSTMEINDIPMAPTTPVQPAPETKVEFYSGPVEMPTPAPSPVNTDAGQVAEPVGPTTIGEPISFDGNVTTNNVVSPVQQQPVEPVQTNNTNNPTNMN